MFDLWLGLLLALGFNLLMFFFAYVFKTDKITDLSYALTFFFLILLSFVSNSYSALKLIMFLMVVLWASRLGIFLFIRIRKMKKDKRFDGMRESFFRFLKFWVLQGLTVWIILLSAMFFMNSPASRVCWLGLIIWVFGLTIEAVADFQKYKFKQKKKNDDKFIQSGLWKYSRHPNYFGEMLCWIGVYVFVFLSLTPLQMLLALASPLFIVMLLLFVTGLPPLEKYADKKWGKEKDYKEYKRKTSILVLWFPKN